MPMLADIDDPPRSRGPGMIVGIVLAAVPTIAIFGYLLPTFVGSIVSSAQDLDARLREQEAYMEQVCAAPELPRDEALCGCVFQVEFPALDCQEHLRPWLVDRAREACTGRLEHATTFCVCAQTLAEDVEAAPDPSARRKILQNVDRCLALPDAPTLTELYSPST